MSTKLQYPINQPLRESPVRPPKSAKSSRQQSGQYASSFYPEINGQRPIHPEETQNLSGGYPRRDREYRLLSDQPEHHNNKHGIHGRASTDSLHEVPQSSSRSNRTDHYQHDVHNKPHNDYHSLPELGKKSLHNSPSSPNPAVEISHSPAHNISSPTPTHPKQQLQIRSSRNISHGNRESPRSRNCYHLPTSIDERVEIGLENLGNTCFMNSALQCLLHIQPLVEYFLKGKMERDINPTSPKKGMLASSFNHLIQEVVAKRSGSAVAPTNFQRAVAVFAPYLLDFQQQDSQEFLRFLLDGMSEDLCRRRQQPLQLTNTVNSPTNNALSNIHSPQQFESSHLHDREKPLSSGSNASTQGGRLSAKSNAPSNSSILPMLPGATIERILTPPHRGDASVSFPSPSNLHHSKFSNNGLDRVESNSNAAALVSPRYNSVHKLRLETRAMQEQQQLQENAANGNNTAGLVESFDDVSAKTRITREISVARKLVSEDMSNTNNQNENNVMAPINFAETAPAALSGMLNATSEATNINSLNINPADGRIESAPTSARTYAPSFSRQLRDVMTGKTLRLRRDRTNSASNNGSNSSNNMTAASPTNADRDGNSDQTRCLDGGDAAVKPVNVEEEAMKAWDRYLKFNDSIITDIFGGLLQSTVQCLTCQHRSYAFDPFLDLSVPIYRDGEGNNKGLFSTIRQVTSSNNSENRSTLEKCLEKFTAEEVLDGDNMVKCERCNKLRKSIKQLSIFRYPKILVVHIKRFRFNNFSREKLSTDVHFPMSALDLSCYLSHDRPKSKTLFPSNNNNNSSNNNQEGHLSQRDYRHSEDAQTPALSASTYLPSSQNLPPVNNNNNSTVSAQPLMSSLVKPATGDEPAPVYDLIGVSNHHGTLNGGHYVAHVDTDYGRSRGQSPRWVCFNDARVSLAQASHIAGPTAYVLFYKLRDEIEIIN